MKSSEESDDPRRRWLIKALALGFFSVGLPFRRSYADSSYSSSPGKLPPGQSIYRIRGSATVNGNEATLKTQIGPSDTVRTGKDSEIVFVVGGNAMILRADSELTLQGSKSEESDNFLISGLRLLTGKILSVSRNQRMQVHSSTATIGIRGTGFYLESDPEQSYFCTCYGVTDVAAVNDPESKDTVESLHHDKPLYILKDAQRGQSIRLAPFVNHTDQELMLIETLVGRTPPFVFPGGDDQYGTPRREY